MKIIASIKNTFLSMHKGVKRFPMSILFAIVISILLNILIFDIGLYTDDDLIHTALAVLVTGFILSLDIHLFSENIAEKFKSIWIKSCLQLIGILFLAWLFIFLYDKNGSYTIFKYTVYSGINIFLFISVFYIEKLNKAQGYSAYVMDIIKAGLKSYIYAGVLLIGVSAILFSLDKLFGIYISSDSYLVSANFTLVLFAMLVFLSSFPKCDRYDNSIKMSKAFYILIMYIVMPLLFIYTMILYAYFALTLIRRELPNGLVGNLVLWYGLVSVVIVFWLSSLQNISTAVSKIKTVYTIAIIPNIIILFMAIYIRISNYGMTLSRYYVVAGGVFIIISMLYYIFRRNASNIFIPVLLSFIVFISALTPIGAYNISRWSQNERLEKILLSNGMIENGKIRPRPELAKEEKYKISEIVEYMYYQEMEIRYLPKDFVLYEGFKEVFGFGRYEGDEYDYKEIEEEDSIINISAYSSEAAMRDISDFDKFVKTELFMMSPEDNGYENKYISLDTSRDNLIINFYDDDTLIGTDKVKLDEILELVNKNGKLSSDEEALYYYENEKNGIKYRLDFNQILLTKDEDTGEYIYINLELFLLYKINKNTL